MLRRDRIKLQVAASNALMHVKGYAAPDTRASLDQARSLIEEVEALGEPLDDPLLCFPFSMGSGSQATTRSMAMQCGSVLRSVWQPRKSSQNTAPLMVGRRLMGISLAHTGDLAEGRANLDSAWQLYNPVDHRPLATRFGQDIGVAIFIPTSVVAVDAWLSRGRDLLIAIKR
jgi:hypothetical protein